MLDRPKVLKELQESTQNLFIDLSSEFELAYKIWKTISTDTTFATKIAAARSPWLIPSWTGDLGSSFMTKQHYSDYTVCAIDGSQIYPDRHQGTSCCLINIGLVSLSYGTQRNVTLNSKPFVFTSDAYNQLENPIDLVNCRRQELELKESLCLCHDLQKKYPNQPMLCMFDGSLIFWHLEGKEYGIKEEFIASYIHSLHQFYLLKIPIIGYISLPGSKELVNLIRMQLANFDPETSKDHKKIEHLLDSHIVNFFLEPFQRTTFFASKSHITNYYPNHLRPHFFYLKLEQEIVRIEFPAWLMQDPVIIDTIVALTLDQASKGNGYPIGLAEAHEQAVVKGADRDFFYHAIQKISFTCKQQLHYSQKSLKKRAIGI